MLTRKVKNSGAIVVDGPAVIMLYTETGASTTAILTMPLETNVVSLTPMEASALKKEFVDDPGKFVKTAIGLRNDKSKKS